MFDTIKTFLESDTPLPKIIVIYGPTACGKSAMAVEVAKRIKDHGKMGSWQLPLPKKPMTLGSYDPHIISADSRQIYRGLDIGTGKVTEAEMQGIPHHMLDVIDPSEKYSMVDFRRDVERLGLFSNIEDTNLPTHQPPIIPILCGGTGLYIDAVLYDMDYPENPPDWKYREELETIRKKEGNDKLWQMLSEVDPEYASELSPSNYRYVMRGLEVIRDTGKSKRESHGTKRLRFSPLFLTPYTDSPESRKALYAKIDQRVKTMFNNGLIEEVVYNIGKFSSHCPGLETIGYKEVVDSIEGRTTLEESIALVAQHSRNYAKRQITWNKRYASHSCS